MLLHILEMNLMKSVKLNFPLLRDGGLRKCRKSTKQRYLCFQKSQKPGIDFSNILGLRFQDLVDACTLFLFKTKPLIGHLLQMRGKMLFWTKNVLKKSVLNNHTL